MDFNNTQSNLNNSHSEIIAKGFAITNRSRVEPDEHRAQFLISPKQSVKKYQQIKQLQNYAIKATNFTLSDIH